MKILILGGTEEARALARRLVASGHAVTSSLAGRTQDPILPEGQLRMGGFGGASGLAAFLTDNGIDILVDATHPYAGIISRNAVAASEQTGVPLVRLMRPEWVPEVGQSWTVVESAQEAADALSGGAQVLLTTGHTDLATYLERTDCRFVVRVIEPPAIPLPGHAQLITSRPPYGLVDEMALMEAHGITHLVSKNSGGEQTAAKLEAAQRLGVTVIMLSRPTYGPAREVASVDAAVEAITA